MKTFFKESWILASCARPPPVSLGALARRRNLEFSRVPRRYDRRTDGRLGAGGRALAVRCGVEGDRLTPGDDGIERPVPEEAGEMRREVHVAVPRDLGALAARDRQAVAPNIGDRQRLQPDALDGRISERG